jgi:tetratricopeptide (TPR) repeat protein
MKTNFTLFSLLTVGLVLSACTGNPASVDRHGNIEPTFQNFTPGKMPSDEIATDSESKAYLPQYNSDGSITIFSINGFNVKIFPMTDGRRRGNSDKTVYEFDDLIEKYRAALQANPQDYEACIMLAGLYVDRGKPGDADLAVQYSDRALAISKNDLQTLYVLRGMAYAKQGDNPKALADLEAVLKMDVQSMNVVYYYI